MKTISNYNFDELINEIKKGSVDSICVIESFIHEDDEFDAGGNCIDRYDETCFAGTTVDECRRTINTLVDNATADEYQYVVFEAGKINVTPEDVENFDPELDDAEDYIADFIADNIDNIDDIGTDDWNVQEVHYDDYKSMKDGIVIYWAWETYVGYARTFKRLEYCVENYTTLRCKPIDQTWTTQCSLLVSAEDIKACKNEEELRDLIQENFDNMGKWSNNCNIDEFLNDIYKMSTLYHIYTLPEREDDKL